MKDPRTSLRVPLCALLAGIATLAASVQVATAQDTVTQSPAAAGQPSAASSEQTSAPPQTSPIPGAQAAIDQVKATGKDVSGLQDKLDHLAGDWKAIEDLQRELKSRIEAFTPQMQGLILEIQKSLLAGSQPHGAGSSPGAGAPGASASPGPDASASAPAPSPVDSIQAGIDTLKATGIDVSDLQPRLDELKTDFDSLQTRTQELSASPHPDPETAKAIQKDAQELQAKLQDLANAMNERAKKAAAGAGH